MSDCPQVLFFHPSFHSSSLKLPLALIRFNKSLGSKVRETESSDYCGGAFSCLWRTASPQHFCILPKLGKSRMPTTWIDTLLLLSKWEPWVEKII